MKFCVTLLHYTLLISFFACRAFYLEKSNLPSESNSTAMKIDQVREPHFKFSFFILVLSEQPGALSILYIKMHFSCVS